MFSARMKELIEQMMLEEPASEEAMADLLEITKASFPNDLLEFMRMSNGAWRDAAFMRLNPVEEWAVDTLSHEAPRKIWMIAGDGGDGAYCWDERRKVKEFVHASTDGFDVWKHMGSTFEEFLEALAASATKEEAEAWQEALKEDARRKVPEAEAKEAPEEKPPERPSPPLDPDLLEKLAVPGVTSGLGEARAPAMAEIREPAAFRKNGLVLRLRCGEVRNRTALSPDGRLLATTHAANQGWNLTVWDLWAKTVVHQAPVRMALKALQFSKDGQRLFALELRVPDEPTPSTGMPPTRYETVVFEVFSGQVILRMKEYMEDGSLAMRTSAEGHPLGLVATRSPSMQGDGHCLVVRDVASGKVMLKSSSGRGGVWISANGRRLVLGLGVDGYAETYDLERGVRMARCPVARPGDVGALAVSPDGTHLATGGGGWLYQPKVQVFELASGKLVHEFKSLMARTPLAVEFLDEDRLVATTKAGTLHLLSLKQKKELERFEFFKNGCYGHIVTAGDLIVAGTTEAKTMMVYRV